MTLTRLPNSTAGCHKTRVSSLDPLRLDGFFPRLPEMNARADVVGMASALGDALPTVDRVDGYSLDEALAAMRDVGLFLGSLKRHGAEPVDAVPALEPVLVRLGRRTDMIPRDTVHHYTEWNPTDDRQRMYTGDAQEGFLMNGARMSLPHLGDSIDLCERLVGLDPSDPDFAPLADELADRIGAFDEAISMVVRTVTPEFFARGMRPYYEEITVGGVTYLGPAAAHVPLFLVDLALWASDHGHEVYDGFIHEAALHTLPQWRSLVPGWERSPSLVTRVADRLRAVGDAEPPADLVAAAKALTRALRALVLFRGKHLTIARKAYREEVRLYELGSGGGSIALLHQILDLTRANSGLVGKGGGNG